MSGLPEPWEYGGFEQFGLVPVAEFYTDADYQWSCSAVFYHPETGTYRYADDGGCSCNGPWDYADEDSFGPPITASQAVWKVRSEPCTGDFTVDAKSRASSAVVDFIASVKERKKSEAGSAAE